MLYGLFSLQTILCISLYEQSDILQHNGTNYKQLLFSSDIWAGTSAMGICAFFYMWHWFGVVVFESCMVDYWGSNDIVTIREREIEAMSICEMVKMVKLYWACTALSLYSSIWDSIFVVSFCGQCSGVAMIYAWKQGVHLPWVYVHSSICETYLV